VPELLAQHSDGSLEEDLRLAKSRFRQNPLFCACGERIPAIVTACAGIRARISVETGTRP
jgi:hypothetical protein